MGYLQTRQSYISGASELQAGQNPQSMRHQPISLSMVGSFGPLGFRGDGLRFEGGVTVLDALDSLFGLISSHLSQNDPLPLDK